MLKNVMKLPTRRVIMFALVVLLPSVIALAMVSSVGADHSLPPELEEHHFAEVEAEAELLALAAAQAADEQCRLAFGPPLDQIICDPQLVEVQADIDNHSDFDFFFPSISFEYQTFIDGAIEGIPPHSHGKGSQLISSGVPGKGLANAPGLQKEFNEKSKAGEKAGKK